jgi:MFS family permease
MLANVLFFFCNNLFFIAFASKNSLYLALVIIGFTHGALLSLFFAITSDIFGFKHYSTLFNSGQVASSVGFYLLNQQLTRMLYHIETTNFMKWKVWGSH